MMLLSNRDVSQTYVDDQSPTLSNSYVGHWTRYHDGNYTKWYLGTYTATSTPGDSFSFTFSGIQAALYGGLSNSNVSEDGSFISYPTADYLLDGSPVGPQRPFFYPSNYIVYFLTQVLEDGTHTINLTVTAANSTNLFIIDGYIVDFITGGPSSGVQSTPASTSTSSMATVTHPASTSTIVGAVVGSLTGIAILTIVLYYILRRKSRDTEQAYYFEKPNPIDIAINEYHVEPFDPTGVATQGPPSANFNGPCPQSANSDSGSNPPSNPPPTQSGFNSLPSKYRQYEDAGVRFEVHEEGEPGLPQSPKGAPPTYTQD